MSAPESKRPADTPFKQQRLKAWQPILTPRWVIGTFFAVAVAFIPIGVSVLTASQAIQEKIIPYESVCPELTYEQPTGALCNQTFTIDEDWEPPIYVYYQLKNFYQNHRRYVQSRSDTQLRGDLAGGTTTISEDDAGNTIGGDCAPAVTTDNMEYIGRDGRVNASIPARKLWNYPCGLVAMSWFNDTFALSTAEGPVAWNAHTGLAWPSDVDKKFKQPSEEWMRANCFRIGVSNTPKAGDAWNTLQLYGLTGFTKPIEPTPQGYFNCWHNVSDEKFIVWMRTAGLPDFKKLYAKIDRKLSKGETFTLSIASHFPVNAFDGKKAFVMSTTRWIGGKNDFLGIAYIVVGALCLLMAVVFLVKHLVSPRVLGDVNYLVWRP